MSGSRIRIPPIISPQFKVYALAFIGLALVKAFKIETANEFETSAQTHQKNIK